MEIEGTYTLQASPEIVWQGLMDQQTIQHAIPGLERLTKIDEQTYSFTLHIRHAPLRGSYNGRISVLDLHYPDSYRLKFEGDGQVSPFTGSFEVGLKTHETNTVVSYKGNVTLGRGNALIPGTMVKATFKVLLQQFFTTLADRLRTERGRHIFVATLEEMYETPFMDEELSEQLLRMGRRKAPTTPLHRLVRSLHLGNANPVAEDIWVRRIRQVGLVSMFVLLVWLGTRLPRRGTATS